MNKPNIHDYPMTDSRTFIRLNGSIDWEKYAKALDEWIKDKP